jgi:N utilization substance protein A
VEGRIVATRAAEYERIHKERSAARKVVPEAAWDIPLADLALSGRVANVLQDNHITSLGDVMMKLDMGDEALLELSGFGPKALEELKEAVAAVELPEPEEEPAVEEAAAAAEETPVAEEAAAVVEEAAVEEPVAAEPAAEEAEELARTEEVEPAAEVTEPEEVVPDIEDLNRPLVEVARPQKTEKKKVVVVQPTRTPAPAAADDAGDARGQKGKQLVFDEKRGQVVVKRKRKGSRRRPGWEEFGSEEEEEV